MDASETNHPRQKRIIGIVGGLGPFAHLNLERALLEAAQRLAGARTDQEFPEWILSSVPQTPDRTLALRGKAPDPVPWLLRSLKRLETRTDATGATVPGADFAVIACNTAHAFVPKLRALTEIPILDMIEETARVVGRILAGGRVGLLASTGTLESGIYHKALERAEVEAVSPLDLPDGESVQRRLVMEPIFGPWRGGRHQGGGIKGMGVTPDFAVALEEAARTLIELGHVKAVVTACTEISLALSAPMLSGVPVIDPVRVIAEAAIRRAYDL